MNDWNIDKSRELYNLAHWSGGYFDLSPDGRLVTRPRREAALGEIDMVELTQSLRDAGLSLPILVRFTDILQHRVEQLREAFDQAREAHGYVGEYTAVYPIKVNQQRRVVEAIVNHGGRGVGLEAGSKSELMAVLALSAPHGIIICNGYKDREYIRLALIGRRLGYRTYIVLEKLSELATVIEAADEMGVEPLLGVRVRLASIGAGKWQNTGGEKSKFGLSAATVLEVVERLRAVRKVEWLQLLHFHLGSQIPNIRDIQRGMGEAARYYAELVGMGVRLTCFDVGGGLGVDYEGTRSRSFCSMNYSVQEYANNVVHALRDVCAESGLPHPRIITESGRAMTAHHAVLLTNVIDIARAPVDADAATLRDDAPPVLAALRACLEEFGQRSTLEVYHEALHWLGEAQGLFVHGLLSLEHRALCERIYHAVCAKVKDDLDPRSRAHREVLDELNERLADHYFCNFSLFQSMPDAWAIDQIFPVMPIQRLDEYPARRAIIEDLTCDSDGRIDYYVDRSGVDTTLPLHALEPGEDYVIAMFMVGAYQEILGDMHNLFGDTDSVNVELDGNGGFRLDQPVRGDTAADLLRYVRFDPQDLLDRYRSAIEFARLDPAQAAGYLDELEAGLSGYTYLED